VTDERSERGGGQKVSRRWASMVRMPSRSHELTAIDIDGEKLRIVQCVTRGRRVLVKRVVAEPLPTSGDVLDLEDPESTGTWIASVLSRLKIRPKSVVMGVPRGQVILKPLNLPAVDDPSELASMVHYQVSKEVPFDPEDAIIDFTVQQLGGSESRADESAVDGVAAKSDEDRGASGARIEVLTATVKRDVVEFYQKEAGAAGLKLQGLGLRSYANVRCLDWCEDTNEDGSVVLVFLRPDEVIIDVLVGSTLTFSRASSVRLREVTVSHEEEGTEEGPEGSETDSVGATVVIDSVAKEVARSLRVYEGMERRGAIAKVLVAGDTGLEWLTATVLADRLDLPCSLLNPATKLNLSGDDAENASAAIVALGLAIGTSDRDGLPFDFLNPKRPPARRGEASRRKVLIAACVIAAFIGALAVRASVLGRKAEEHQILQSQIDSLKQREAEFKKLRIDAKNARDWIAGDRKWLKHWSYLSAVLPPCTDVYADNITTSSRGLRFSLHARSGEILAGLDEVLREAGYRVSPMAITPSEDKYGYGFRTTVELAVPSSMKIDLSRAQPPERPADDMSSETGDAP